MKLSGESNTQTEIKNYTAKFAKAVTNKDFAMIGTYYEEQARWLPPGGRIVEGRAAIQTAQQKMIESGVQTLDLEAIDIIESGDFVIEIGRITVTIRPVRIVPWWTIIVKGKSVVVWRRQKDGSLKIVADIFNSDRSR
jgi:ketosteroid isomerase-like protein